MFHIYIDFGGRLLAVSEIGGRDIPKGGFPTVEEAAKFLEGEDGIHAVGNADEIAAVVCEGVRYDRMQSVGQRDTATICISDADGRASDWFTFDAEKEEWDFSLTENKVLSPYFRGPTRIGGMSREELVQAVAFGYHERDKFANALAEYFGQFDASELADLFGDETAAVVDLALVITATAAGDRRGRPPAVAEVIDEEWAEYSEWATGKVAET